MTYVIAEPCIDVMDRSCVDVCPVDCIHEIDRMLVIDPDECIDCGACEPECPVEAIFPEDAVPDGWLDFVTITNAFGEGRAAGRARRGADRGPRAAADRGPSHRRLTGPNVTYRYGRLVRHASGSSGRIQGTEPEVGGMRERFTGSVRNKLFRHLRGARAGADGGGGGRHLVDAQPGVDQADDLAHVDAEAMEQVAGRDRRMQEVFGHVVNHLYVYDGDLAAQDAQAAAIETLKGEIGERLDTLAPIVEALEPASQERFAAALEARKAYVAAYDQALALSRQETVSNAEDRDGSRAVYVEQVEPALDTLNTDMTEFADGIGGT